MNTQEFTLSSLDKPIKIPDQQINEFREKGHTLIRGLLSEGEVAASRNIIAGAVEKFNTEKRKMEDRDTYGKAFLQIKNFWQNDVDVKKIVLSKRLGRVAADLLGAENVRIYHDQALFKEPGGGHTPWHQNLYYWPLDTDKTITMWMPLVDIDVKMGMLTFASRSHQNGSVLDYEISDKSEEEFDKYVRENNLEISRA
jgi:ectoine hydroxylase-related dioxygenase (phytanoyl-CoA dioxygenase family)